MVIVKTTDNQDLNRLPTAQQLAVETFPVSVDRVDHVLDDLFVQIMLHGLHISDDMLLQIIIEGWEDAHEIFVGIGLGIK